MRTFIAFGIFEVPRRKCMKPSAFVDILGKREREYAYS